MKKIVIILTFLAFAFFAITCYTKHDHMDNLSIHVISGLQAGGNSTAPYLLLTEQRSTTDIPRARLTPSALETLQAGALFEKTSEIKCRGKTVNVHLIVYSFRPSSKPENLTPAYFQDLPEHYTPHAFHNIQLGK